MTPRAVLVLALSLSCSPLALGQQEAGSGPSQSGRIGALHRLPGAEDRPRGNAGGGTAGNSPLTTPPGENASSVDRETWRNQGHAFLNGQDPERPTTSPDRPTPPGHCAAPEGDSPFDGLGAPTLEDAMRRLSCGMVAGIDALLERGGPNSETELRNDLARTSQLFANPSALRSYLGHTSGALTEDELAHVAKTFRGVFGGAMDADDPVGFLLDRRARLADPAFVDRAVTYMEQERARPVESVTERIQGMGGAPSGAAGPPGNMPGDLRPHPQRPGFWIDPATGAVFDPAGNRVE